MNRLLRVFVSIGAVSIFTLSSTVFAVAKQQPAGAVAGSGAETLDGSNQAQSQTGEIELTGVDCTTADTCYAVGVQIPPEKPGDMKAILVQIQDGIAGNPRIIPEMEGLYHIACISADTCYALGFASGGAMLLPLVDGQAETAEPIPNWNEQGAGLGCSPDGTTCYVVSSSAPVHSAVGVVIPIVSGDIGQTLTVPQTGDLSDVACPTNHVCYAVGSQDSGDGTEAVLVPITDGAVGTPEVIDGAGYLTSIVCPTSDLCYASGASAVFTLTDGAVTGSEPLSPSADVPGPVLGCSGAATCFALGRASTGINFTAYPQGDNWGYPVIWTLTDGGGATSQTPPVAQAFSDIACPASGMCVVVGDEVTGFLGRYTQPTAGLVLTITGGVVGEPQLIPYSGS